jgi:eukaryotic-like serine/threonine-protein kinase
MSRLGSLGRFLIGGIVFVCLAVGAGWATLLIVTSGGDVLVPDITGKDVVSSLKILQEQKLYGAIEGEETHATIQREHVIRQDPKPGELRKEYSTVKLVLSTGPDRMLMPDMRGYGIRQARIESSQMGLGTVTEINIHHANYHQGEVVAHSPGPDEIVLPGGPVSFLVSLGSNYITYRMPDFIGQPISEAQDMLEPAFSPDVVQVTNAGIAPGTIISQSPKAGEPIEENQIIKLEVSGNEASRQDSASVFIYKVPEGFISKKLTALYASNGMRKTYYDQTVNPSEEIRLSIPKTGSGTIEILLDDVLVKTQPW